MLPTKLQFSSTMNQSINPTAKQYSYNEVVNLFRYEELVTLSECPKDIKLPKAVFDEVENHLEEMLGLGDLKIYDEVVTMFDVDEEGEVYFSLCDRAANQEFFLIKIQALLEPYGVKLHDVLEEEYQKACALPLEEKFKLFRHC